jgi:hypothetical protein
MLAAFCVGAGLWFLISIAVFFDSAAAWPDPPAANLGPGGRPRSDLFLGRINRGHDGPHTKATTMNAGANQRAKAILSKCFLNESRNGTPEVVVTFGLLGVKDQEIVWRAYMSDAAIEKSVATLKMMGWDGDLETLKGIDSNTVRLTIDEEEYDGKTQLRVQWVNEDAPFKALDGDKAKALAQSLKEKVAAAMKANQAKPPPERKASAAKKNEKTDPAAEGGELPF